MRPITPTLASVAAAIVFTASTTALAQVQQVRGNDRTNPDANARQQAVRARQRRALELSNQLRPFYRYELMHVRSACGLSKQQLREIRTEADAAYDEAIASLEVARPASPLSTDDDEPDYHEAIRKAVHSVARRHVSREQWDALQADLRLRSASRKDAALDLLVAVLDRDLLLTGRQRQQIGAAVAAHWDDRFVDPLEVSFNDQSRCPKIPDDLVTPYLSAAQRAAWNRIPRLQGRLWGVTIDHGGGPDMEEELGAIVGISRTGATGRRVPPAPNRMVIQPGPADAALAARARAQQLQMRAAQLQALEVRAPRPAVVVGRPAPPPDGDDEPEADREDVIALQQQFQLQQMKRLQAAYLSRLERQVFGGANAEASARRAVETALEHRVDYLRLAGRLTDEQWKKLRAAGHGDIKRFFDRFAEVKAGMAATNDPRAMARMAAEAAPPLAGDWTALQTVEGPVFTKTLDRTLTQDQRTSMAREDRDRLAFRLRADVRWTTVLLARSLGLKDDQRSRLESLLLERTIPPEKFETSDYVIVMFQAARIPQSEIRPIFDDVQWRVMAQEFAAVQRWEVHLKKGGFFREEMFGDPAEAPLPPIHLLAPPPARARR
jgi:hypothetical protein